MIHANMGSNSSLHVHGVTEPLEPPWKRQFEPLEQCLLLGFGLRHVPQIYRRLGASRLLGQPADSQFASFGGHVLLTEDLELGLRFSWGLTDHSQTFINLGVGLCD